MIDINNKDFKLLRMNESLLSKLTSDDPRVAKTLDDYCQLAVKIDRSSYLELLQRVINYDHNQTLEEELEYLELLQVEYQQLDELQHRFRKVYQMYAPEELSLSMLSDIDIDKINDRKDTISGYLINSKNFEECKKRLEEANERLVIEEKIKENNYKRFQQLEEELKSSLEKDLLINTANPRYVGINNEYIDNDIDLERLLSDVSFLTFEIKQTRDAVKEKEEALATAKICYDSNPNKDTKEIYDSFLLEYTKIKYRLLLLEIIQIINNYECEYDKLIEKRETLLRLIKERKGYLNILGINFMVDPFKRLRIEEQLEYLNKSLRDNRDKVLKVRKDIEELSDRYDDIVNKNSELLRKLNSMELNFVKQANNLSKFSIPVEEVVDNLVIESKNLPEIFARDRVKEKTSGVIKRVSHIIEKEVETKNEGISPELILEQSTKEEDNDDIFAIEDITGDKQNQEEKIFQDNVDSPFIDIQLFNDRSSEDSIRKELDDETLSKNELKQEENNFQGTKDIHFGNDYKTDDKPEDTSEKLDSEDIEFQELPNIFWPTDQEETVEESLSLDDQIKRYKLIA